VGKSCIVGSQCTSGTCRSEDLFGWPGGSCIAGLNTCNRSDAGVSTGCPANAVCLGDQFGTFCRQRCGSGGTACRSAYACHDDDEDSSSPSWCTPMCSSDADCRALGGTYGCNLWSRLCEVKDKQQAKYGGACSTNTDCESGLCQRESSNGGYCYGWCQRSGGSCGGDGVCEPGPSGDNTGRCLDGCSMVGSATECRAASRQTCGPAPTGSVNACYCRVAGERCSTSADCCIQSGFPIGGCVQFINICGL
jgi:hypothetical protein